jgi:rhodanese-related sulfurtransferase
MHRLTATTLVLLMLGLSAAGNPFARLAAGGHESGSIALSIMPHQLQALLGTGGIGPRQLIDLRPLDQYARAHLPQARSMQPSHVEPLQREIPRDELVVIYGSTTMDAVETFAVLRRLGYRNVRVLAGGFSAWTQAGFPVEAQP